MCEVSTTVDARSYLRTLLSGRPNHEDCDAKFLHDVEVEIVPITAITASFQHDGMDCYCSAHPDDS
jgi:hypothetical protein